MLEAVAAFHFLRPWWLLGMPVSLMIWRWMVVREKRRLTLDGTLASHLVEHLVVHPKAASWFQPRTVLVAVWIVASLALAGPTFRLQPNPFADDKAGLFIVLHLSESMNNTDLPPTRLEQTRIKLRALINARSGAPTGLIAYSGTAHLVMPLTTDGDVIDYQLQALSPELMPQSGDATSQAIQLAMTRLSQSASGGSILLVSDSVTTDQIERCGRLDSPRLQIWAPLRDDSELEPTGLQRLGEEMGSPVLSFAADTRDVATVERRSSRALATVTEQDSSRWADDGYWCLPLLVVFSSLWCRRGWSLAR